MEKNKELNIVFINSKDNYGIQMRRIGFCLKNHRKCIIKTRGNRNIGNMVNMISFMLENNSIKDFKISGSKFVGEDKKERHVPELEVTLCSGKGAVTEDF